MIENHIKADLELITGLRAYPLKLPDTAQEGITYQRISDAELNTGLAKTGVVQYRFQIGIILTDDYTRLLSLDVAIRSKWCNLQHAMIGTYPVQHVDSGGVWQDKYSLPNNKQQYRLTRDYLIYSR